VAQNTSAPLDLTERRIAIGLHCWSSRPAHRAASSQELRRRRPAPALRPPHLRGPFLLSCCTSSARAGRCCPAPCSPSQPGLGVPDSRRTAGARVSAENCCGPRSRSVRRLRLSHLIQWTTPGLNAGSATGGGCSLVSKFVGGSVQLNPHVPR